MEMDGRGWDEGSYRRSILMGRELSSRTVFRAVFSPPKPNQQQQHGDDDDDDDVLVFAASSDGSLASYSLSQCISTSSSSSSSPQHMDPVCVIEAHKGPAYDLKFYGHGGHHHSHSSLLFSCGDDGHIRAWSWLQFLKCDQGIHLEPVLDLVNPQHEGPWCARSPIPENNAIATNEQVGSVFAAAGDACAYCWDVETGKCKMIFRGHLDYLHTIAVRKSSNQIITGSEDGTARIWDCRSGKCTQLICPEKNHKYGGSSSISCIAVDTSESWLACGTCSGLSVWSLLSNDCIFNMDYHAPFQDLLFDKNQILAVGSEPVLSRFTINGDVLSQIKCAPTSAFSVSVHSSGVAAVAGYGGLVDIISEFGSHLCTFGCRGLDKYP